jgi:ankyrin repeat protein
MLSNIEAESADDARRILILLCTAKRPLAVEELIDGIAVELGEDPKFNKDSRLMNEDDIRHICPGFIEIHVHQEDDIPWGPYKTAVRIAHYSVQEYLESDRILAGETASFSVRPMQASTEVASICLAYLMDPELCEAPMYVTGFPFAMYAMRNWPDHYSEADGSDSRLHRLVVDLFHHEEVAFVNWAKLQPKALTSIRDHKDGNLARLCLAARFGLDQIVRMLADKPVPIPRPKDYFGPALLEAAGHGHDTSVRLLLGYGANVDCLDNKSTALHLASRHGNVKVVKTLLDHGADIEGRIIYFLTPPLCEAAGAGHDEVVGLLLDRGADINPTGSHRTPLEAAASGGFENVVTTLLDRGADPNRGRADSPLEAAAEHANIGQLIIRRGADIDQAGEGLLERAVLCGNAWMIRLLLDRGVDVNVGKVNTPLEAACYWPRDDALQILQLLLDNGADVNGGIERTPLEAATRMGHRGIIRPLLDRGADASLGIRRTPLEATVQVNATDIHQLLLDRGADVNLGIERTPLEVAAKRLSIGHIQLLLDRGADVNLGIQQTPLEAAVSKVRRKHVRLFLDPGAEANLDFETILREVDTSGEAREAMTLLVCNGAGASGDIDTTLLELLAGQDGKALKMVQPDAGGRTETTLSQPADKKRNGILTPRLSDSAEKAK